MADLTAKLLGPDDEPQGNGAVVAVHYGDYRRQEIWVASGTNIGAWYPLGGEHWVVWERQRMPAGVTKNHPTWADVLARGPVVLLVPAQADGYAAGWRAGRKALWESMEDAVYDDPDPEVAIGSRPTLSSATDKEIHDMPQAWAELIEGLTLLAKGQSNGISPLHCEHDQLTVMADPADFTEAELARLDELGFSPNHDEATFTSFRFGSA